MSIDHQPNTLATADLIVVASGEYSEYLVLAVLADEDDARLYVQEYNRVRPRGSSEAYVDGKLPFYAAGAFKPAGQVIDGTVVGTLPATR